MNDLETKLINLLNYGKPSISYLKNGWYCQLTLNTSLKGVKAELVSEFNHENPYAAILEIEELLHIMLYKYPGMNNLNTLPMNINSTEKKLCLDSQKRK